MSEKESPTVFDIPDPDPSQSGSSRDEFAHIPSARRHPAMALAAVAVALLLIFQVRTDFFYALSSSAPRDLGTAQKLALTPIEQLPLNRTVKIQGMADRESGLLIDTLGSWEFTQFFRLLGSQNRVFVQRVPNPIPPEIAARDVFTGRLMRFRDLSFQESIRAHFANRVAVTHLFDPILLTKALAKPSADGMRVTDLLGEEVTLFAQDVLSLDIPKKDAIVLELPREKFPDTSAARSEVEKKGGKVLEAGKGEGEWQSFVISLQTETREALLHDLGNMHPKVRLRPAHTTLELPLSALSVEKDTLWASQKGQRLAISPQEILAVRTLATVRIPEDALFLAEGSRPRDHWKSIGIVAVLLGFATMNLFWLRRKA